MDSPRETPQRASTDGWKALAWACASLAIVGAAGALALPPSHPSPFVPSERTEFWRPEWLLLATLVVVPLYFVGRRCWWLALPVLAIASAQLYFVAASGVEILGRAGLETGADTLWYAVGAAQGCLCLAAGVAGARENLGYRRWLREMTLLMPTAAASTKAVDDPWPKWEEGFFSTG